MRARDICVTAMLTAVLTGSKLALSFLPNIEIVTLLLIVYTLTLGIKRASLICLVFILIECFIWGFGWWVIIYFAYWPVLVLIIGILPKIKLRIPLAIIIGIAFTALFGVLSSLIEISITGALGSPNFWKYFKYRYIAGVSFFVTHIISNVIILPVLVPPLYLLLKKICN